MGEESDGGSLGLPACTESLIARWQSMGVVVVVVVRGSLWKVKDPKPELCSYVPHS